MYTFSVDVKVQLDQIHGIIDFFQNGLQTELVSLSKEILKDNKDNHLQEKDPDGIPWIPSLSGLERKRNGGGGTLYDTGTLFDGSIIKNSFNTFSIVNDVDYAAEHQFGIDQITRPFLGIPDKFVDSLIKTIESNI